MNSTGQTVPIKGAMEDGNLATFHKASLENQVRELSRKEQIEWDYLAQIRTMLLITHPLDVKAVNREFGYAQNSWKIAVHRFQDFVWKNRNILAPLFPERINESNTKGVCPDGQEENGAQGTSSCSGEEVPVLG